MHRNMNYDFRKQILTANNGRKENRCITELCKFQKEKPVTKMAI